MAIRVEDHSMNIKAELTSAVSAALQKCGLLAEGYAKKRCPVDTGNLRNSITNQVQDKTMMIGTNVHYAPYVEFGTGRRSTVGGQKTIAGQKPQPYIKPAITDHIGEYESIIRAALK